MSLTSSDPFSKIVSSIKAKLGESKDESAVLPAQPDLEQDSQVNLWDYLDDGEYHRKYLSHMPSARDRDNLDEKHRQIWDFFFRFDPDKVGVDKRNRLNDLDKELKNLTSRKGGKEQEIRDLETTTQHTAAPQESAVKSSPESKAQLQKELQKLNNDIEIINMRKQKLEEQIKELGEQIPQRIPSGDEIARWLDEDWARLRLESIGRTGIAQLQDVGFHNSEGDEIRVKNPIVLIAPAELQHPSRIPPAYRPPQYNFIQRAVQQTTQRLADFIQNEPLSSVIRPASIRDQVKHLLTKQTSMTSNGYRFFWGVYYVEQLLLAKDMLTKHSLFFDFITGKTTGNRVVEIYFQDIVSIEQNEEYRNLPIGYDSDKTLPLEDVPTLRFSLTSGDSHEITFVNQDYYYEVMGHVTEEKNISEASRNEFIRGSVRKVSEQADAAIKVLRQCLREHKGLLD